MIDWRFYHLERHMAKQNCLCSCFWIRKRKLISRCDHEIKRIPVKHFGGLGGKFLDGDSFEVPFFLKGYLRFDQNRDS